MMQSAMQLGTETSVVMESGAAAKNQDNSLVPTFVEPQSALMQFYHDLIMKGKPVQFAEI